MRIKYVGLKDEETKFSKELGIVWKPGSVHDVPDAWAKRMLRHPDVWAREDVPSLAAAATAPAGKPAGEEEDERNIIIKPDGTEVVLDELDGPALHALAKELSVKVHHSSGKARVIEALMDSATEPGAK